MYDNAIVLGREVVRAEVLHHIVQNKQTKLKTLLHSTFKSLVECLSSERVNKLSNHV